MDVHRSSSQFKLDPSSLFPWLVNFFTARYQGQPNKSLIDVYKVHKEFQEWDSAQLESLFQQRVHVMAFLEHEPSRAHLTDVLARMTAAFVYQGRNYLPPTEKNHRRLQHLFQQGLQETLHLLQTAEARYWQSAYRMLLKCHLVRLHAVMASLMDPAQTSEFNYAWLYRDALTSEYSPEWQLQALGLSEASVGGEVLDLGCGKQANLVRFLRRESRPISGLDRWAAPQEGVTQGDWFELSFKPERWDLIMSHVAFSAQAWFHMSTPGESEKYAAKYQELLHALKPKGRFVYFPALPFLEHLISPDQFQCCYQEVPGSGAELHTSGPRPLCAHVTRIV